MRTNRLKNGQIRHFSVCRPCFTPVKLSPSHRKAHEFFSFSGAKQFWEQENFSQTKPQNEGIPAYSEALRQSIRKILPPKTDLSLSPLTHVPFRQSLLKYSEKYGVTKAAKKYDRFPIRPLGWRSPGDAIDAYLSTGEVF